eukprot:scaffold12484_cov63-Phaeocystis_antarctica.AAC.3
MKWKNMSVLYLAEGEGEGGVRLSTSLPMSVMYLCPAGFDFMYLVGVEGSGPVACEARGRCGAFWTGWLDRPTDRPTDRT